MRYQLTWLAAFFNFNPLLRRAAKQTEAEHGEDNQCDSVKSAKIFSVIRFDAQSLEMQWQVVFAESVNFTWSLIDCHTCR